MNTLWLRLRALWKRRQLDRDLEDELRFHLEMREAGYRAGGVTGDEARFAAQRRFGNPTAFKEVCRDMWTFVSIETFWQDLRFASRMLRKQPGFTAMAIFSLALGIGANSAVFTIVNDLLLKNLPVADPASLVSFGKAEGGGVQGGISGNLDILPYQLYQRLAAQHQFFEGICAYGSFPIFVNVLPAAQGGPSGRAQGALVTGDYFSVLGVTTPLGRPLDVSDASAPSLQPVAVISYDYWQRAMGADPSAIGRSVNLNGVLYTIVGVAPQGFYGVTLGAEPPDFWIPLTMQAELMHRPSMLGPGGVYWLHMMGRMKPGASRSQAEAWLKLELQHYMLDSEGKVADVRRQEIERSYIQLLPGGRGVSGLRGRYAESLNVLMGVVALVLLVACANLANFFLSKTAAREREITTRLALGAGVFRIARQMLTEALLLSFIGGAAGLALASWATRVLIHFVVESDRTSFDPNPDLRVIAFTFGLSLLTGLLFGLAPAYRAARTSLTPGLKAGRMGRLGLSKALVTAQVALALVLLVGAGLLVRTLQNLAHLPFGFDDNHLLAADIDLRLAGYKPAQLPGLFQRIQTRLQALPGAQSASISAAAPLSDGSWVLATQRLHPDGQSKDSFGSIVNSVTPEYFATTGATLIAGREITAQDVLGRTQVAVINQTLANRLFPKGDAIGNWTTFGPGHDNEFQVVGILKDGKYQSPREEPRLLILLPLMQLTGEDLFANVVMLRIAGDSAQAERAFRQALAEVDSNIPVRNITAMRAQIEHSMAREALISRLAGFFSLLALLLACIGLYGVMSYTVVRRTNEIGIRMALGANGGTVLWMVLRDALRLLAYGIAIGVPVTLAATRALQSQLFGLSSYDPATVSVALAAIAVVTIAAGYFPARRASHTDPLQALRYE